MNGFSLILAACISGLCGIHADLPSGMVRVNLETQSAASSGVTEHAQRRVGAGDYLISRFAQQHHDWENAQKFTNALVDAGIDQDDVVRRAMVLSMGAGDFKTAMDLAAKLVSREHSPLDPIAQLFLIVEAVQAGDFDLASKRIGAAPQDATSRFIMPYVDAWTQAARGKLYIGALKENTLQLYHAILISDYLNDHSEIKKTLQRAISVEDINASELMRIGDIFAHVGEEQKALALYDRALEQVPEDPEIINRRAALQDSNRKPLFLRINSPSEGMARAFSDIATVLYQEYNDESARIFANIALYLQPNTNDALLLLAHIATRHKQNEEAIRYYSLLPAEHDNHKAAQYKIADLLVELDRHNEALAMLGQLVKNSKDVEAQIRIGDVHRRSENYGQALVAYNDAVKMLGGKIPDEFWHLYYVRGMVQEQIGNWNEAESDLKNALALQPDHPYILNYLGYSWADRGMNLPEALEMIARAVKLRPSDGYIMDSLGWVKYKMKNYEKAAPILERAVALMPYDPIINDHLGDAYWKVGRKREARFQWERAKNHSKDEEMQRKISDKIENGLPDEPAVAAGVRN